MPSAARFLLLSKGADQSSKPIALNEGQTGQAVEMQRDFFASNIIKYDPCGLF